MTEIVLTPPSGEDFGYVALRLIDSWVDGTDSGDTPDYTPARGTVRFRPKELSSRRTDAIVLRNDVVVGIDETTGELVNRETMARGPQKLWAAVWTVDFSGVMSASKPANFDFEVRPEHTLSAPLQLAKAQPYTPPKGVSVQTVLLPTAVPGKVLGATSTGLAWVDAPTGPGGVTIYATKAEAQAAGGGFYIDSGSVVPTDPELTQVTAAGPTWTDNTTSGGGTWTTPTEAGVTYSPASGTATAGQSVTVTATAKAGYALTGVTSWQHTFPAAAATPVTATAPTADDAADTYTIPSKTGVEYLVGGSVKPAGTYSVGDVDATVTVTARATTGYNLTGASSWTLTFTKKAVASVPSGAYDDAVLADNPGIYVPLDDAAGTTAPRVLGAWSAYNTIGLVGSPAPTFGAAGVGDGATSLAKSVAASGFTTNEAEVMRGATTAAAAGSGLASFTLEILVDGLSSAAPSAGGSPVYGLTQAVIGLKGDGRVTGPAGLEQSTTSGPLSTRMHLAYTWDGTTARLYRNGTEVASSTTLKPALTFKNKLFLDNSGGWSPTGRFGGAALYDKALAASRILAHAQAAGLA